MIFLRNKVFIYIKIVAQFLLFKIFLESFNILENYLIIIDLVKVEGIWIVEQ
jgi:hypothetical protein